MTPELVQRYLERATDAAVADYLQRLLQFSREQTALACRLTAKDQARTGDAYESAPASSWAPPRA